MPSNRTFELEVLNQGLTAHQEADKQIAEVAAGGGASPPIACQAGCAWCCYLLVSVTVPEAVAIAEQLRSMLSGDQLDAVIGRLAELDSVTRGLTAQERAEQRLPCALLVDNQCSVYPLRPLSCRGWNAFDAAQCEQALLRADERLDVDYNGLIRKAAATVQLGLLTASLEAGRAVRLLELTAALRIALEIPDAAARWARGEDVFAAASDTPVPG